MLCAYAQLLYEIYPESTVLCHSSIPSELIELARMKFCEYSHTCFHFVESCVFCAKLFGGERSSSTADTGSIPSN